MNLRVWAIALLAMAMSAFSMPAFAGAFPPITPPLDATGSGGSRQAVWRATSARPRQVSGLPWSRVWVERNLFRNKGR